MKLHHIVLILLFIPKNSFSGFLAGTLVKTPIGHIPIEQLHINDAVICYDLKNSFTIKPITHTVQNIIHSYIKITLENECINISPNHLFYLPQKKIWAPANMLHPGDILLKNFTEYAAIQNIIFINNTQNTYDITVADYHNFCVSPLNITTHNFFPAVALGISFLFGGGIEFAGAMLTAALGGASIAIVLKKSKNSPSITIHPSSNSPSGYPGDPEEDPEKKRTFNTIHKSEFFNKIKDEYEHYKNGIYRRKRNARGIENAEYLEWDNLHNDVEAYTKNKHHLGSINPHSCRIYKNAISGRTLPKS